jgi:hypothetical protein
MLIVSIIFILQLVQHNQDTLIFQMITMFTKFFVKHQVMFHVNILLL